jgi:5-methyltetrahydropteroyltriglutamate--homocysteine methyltransferase
VSPGPPFRADHVGSLLRPPELLSARERFSNGGISAEELGRAEDEAIRVSVSAQGSLGLPSATDGEFRRNSWHMDFIYQLGGIATEGRLAVAFRNDNETLSFTPSGLAVDGPVHLDQPIFADAFTSLASMVTTATPELTIPSPSMVHYRGGRASIDLVETAEEVWD